jgi:succinoglycan biosynthesis transport protein ExoP
VSPALAGEAGVPGVTLLRASPDPIRNVETVARLVTAPAVMRRVTRDLRLDRTSAEVRAAIDASPVAESDIVTITARDSNPRLAKALADAVGEAAVAERTEALHAQLDEVIPRVRVRVAETVDARTKEVLASRLADLQTLREMPDPTLRTATKAELPTSPVAPRPKLSLIVAILAGLLVGVGGVIALQLLDPRIVSDDQLRDRYRLPILARIRRARPFRGGIDDAALREFRTLRAAVLSRDGHNAGERVVVLLAPSRADAKASALNLAGSLAAAGRRVLVAEMDGGRPSLARTLQEPSAAGLMDVLRGDVTVEDAAVPASGATDGISLLLNGSSGDRLPDVLDTRAAYRLVEDAARVSDWLVVAAPPYAHVTDALPLAHLAGHVVLVVRSGVTRTSQLRRLTDLLGDHGIEPAGFVVLGSRNADGSH